MPIIPVVASVPAARAAQQSSQQHSQQQPASAPLTLAPGRATPSAPASSAQTLHPAPAAAAPRTGFAVPAATPAPAGAPPSGANAYFEWFQPCRCGHSSAWHGGAFGDAWRTGHQVQGACEASASEGSVQRCPCSHFGSARH